MIDTPPSANMHYHAGMTAEQTEQLQQAGRLLREGKIVAFATETVYGLGADATNPAAVRRVFDLKGRPSTNPLIVHVPDIAAARAVVAEWPADAEALANAFWPGPLTLVLPKAKSIVDEVTAGLQTVAVRVPRHPLALALLREAGVPVAAPSANRSQHVSPTTADHVRVDFGDAVPILDGGRCETGIESTVISLTGATPTILRPGGVGSMALRDVLGGVINDRGSDAEDTASSSPGRGERHYAPTIPAFRFDGGLMGRLMRDRKAPAAVLVIGQPIGRGVGGHKLITMPADPEGYASAFYATLREIENDGVAEIWIELPPGSEPWTAVRDRITRATLPMP